MIGTVILMIRFFLLKKNNTENKASLQIKTKKTILLWRASVRILEKHRRKQQPREKLYLSVHNKNRKTNKISSGSFLQINARQSYRVHLNNTLITFSISNLSKILLKFSICLLCPIVCTRACSVNSSKLFSLQNNTSKLQTGSLPKKRSILLRIIL